MVCACVAIQTPISTVSAHTHAFVVTILVTFYHHHSVIMPQSKTIAKTSFDSRLFYCFTLGVTNLHRKVAVSPHTGIDGTDDGDKVWQTRAWVTKQ